MMTMHTAVIIRRLTFMAALALPLVGGAVPAKPGITTRVVKDGVSAEYRLCGDEFNHYAVDAAGKVVSEAKSQGGLERSLATVTDGRTTFPTINDSLRCLVVMMQFEDTKFKTADPRSAFNAWLNEEGYSEWGAKGSVRDFYIACSRGKFKPTFEVSPVVTISMTSAEATQAYPECFDEALSLVYETGEMDFSNYDADNNGEIDFVYFIYAGYGYADTGISTCIWPHASTLTKTTYSGLSTGSYACSMELRGSHLEQDDGCLAGIGTFCHEFAHVLGLPDYYDVGYTGVTTPEDWDTMASGPYNEDSTCPPLFSAYERWMLYWDEIGEGITLLGDPCSVSVAPLSAESTNAYIQYNPDDSNECYIFECRTKNGWDSGLPGEGLLIWHVAYSNSIWNKNTVNTDGVSRYLPLRTGSDQGTCAFPDGAALNYLSQHSFGLPLINGGCMPTTITDITFDGTTAAFDFNIKSEGTQVTNITSATKGEDGRSTYKIRLEWEAVADAESYELTLTRTNKQGHSYIMGDADNLNVGNVTSFELGDITSAQMNHTWTATLRVISTLPSAETTEYEFIPAELADMSGIASLHCDEATEIGRYSIDGRRLTQPSPGINIVVYSDSTTKKETIK